MDEFPFPNKRYWGVKLSIGFSDHLKLLHTTRNPLLKVQDITSFAWRLVILWFVWQEYLDDNQQIHLGERLNVSENGKKQSLTCLYYIAGLPGIRQITLLISGKFCNFGEIKWRVKDCTSTCLCHYMTMEPIWRCISHWKWWFSDVMLVFRVVVPVLVPI